MTQKELIDYLNIEIQISDHPNFADIKRFFIFHGIHYSFKEVNVIPKNNQLKAPYITIEGSIEHRKINGVDGDGNNIYDFISNHPLKKPIKTEYGDLVYPDTGLKTPRLIEDTEGIPYPDPNQSQPIQELVYLSQLTITSEPTRLNDLKNLITIYIQKSDEIYNSFGIDFYD